MKALKLAAMLFSVAIPAEASASKVARFGLYGIINDDTAKAIIGAIKESEDAGAANIVIEINTPGGEVDAGYDIIKAIEETEAFVTCVVDTEAESMGFAILQSCDRRYMTKRSKLMAHEPSLTTVFGGQPNEWQARADSMAAEREALAEQCCRRLKVSMEEYRKRTDGGQMWFMNWRDAVKFGAVDGVVMNAKSVARQLARHA